MSETTRHKKPRDVRLDFFRGLCLVIIFIAHVWDNPWAAFIPARFGLSDATEIFVFCSGMASALAFGSVFVRGGLLMGAARIAFRCWQVYWAHIGTFIAAAVGMIAVDRLLGTGGDYVEGLELAPFLGEHVREGLLGLVTLTYVPHYFDILPMYLVILAMIPVVMMLAAADKRLVLGFVVASWTAATLGLADLPAEPWGTRPWFFNPFAWQLVFFTGFAFMSGWLPAPPLDRRLVYAAAVVVAASVPLSWTPLVERLEPLAAAREAIAPLIDKTRFGVLRYVHFLSLAYLAYVAVGEGGRRLSDLRADAATRKAVLVGIAGSLVEVLRRLGQQSLAVFMSGLVLSFLASAVLNMTGRSFTAVALVNVGGIAILIAIAQAVTWFKSQPWSLAGQASQKAPVAKPAAVREDARANDASMRIEGASPRVVPAE